MSELLWVAIPNGLQSPSRALIRVLVVPRLAPGTLAEFGLWDWPALLADASFELRVKAGSGKMPPAVARYEPRARSEVWHAFFDGDAGTIDEPRKPTYPTPTVSETHKDARDVVGSYRQTSVMLAAPKPQADAQTIVRQQIDRWYDPTPPPAVTQEPIAPLPPMPDFHQAVALLREHPAVMQDLGLIFELTVAVADLDAGDAEDRYLSIRCPDSPLNLLVKSPWTKYELDGDAFWPAPAAGSKTGIGHGMIDLQGVGPVVPADGPPPAWAIGTLDVDGATSALRATAVALRSGADGRPPELPSVRTAGLMLLRPERQTDFDERMKSAAMRAGSSMDQAELTADDLVLGYRMDIRSGVESTWRSLCERDATYTVRDPSSQLELSLGGSDRREEGHVKPHAAVKTDDGKLHADEVVVRWDGWSLALPPVNLLDDTPGAVRKPGAELPYDFRWEYCVPPGRLPRLRFATTYRIRVRIADLAGGGPTLDDLQTDTFAAAAGEEADEPRATRAIMYTRHDPVPPPLVGADGPLAQGAAVDRLVIRSDHNMTVAQFHAAEPEYPEVERRTILPPTASFAIVEQHGMLDPPQSDERTWDLAQRALRADGDGSAGLRDPMASGICAHVPAEPGGLTQPWTDQTAWPAWPDEGSRHVELREGDSQHPIVARWAGDRLEVRLAKAEQVTIELSSTIRDGFLDHFEVFGWLAQANADGTWVTNTLHGRHPMLSPRRKVEVVHAVKRPLDPPVWQLPEAAISRAKGATTALLRPTFGPRGLNTDSTGRLEVAAAWREWDDSGDRDVTIDHLHGETVARGAPPTPSIRHEFGDTKHRRVLYTLTAISRFRQFFDPDEPEAAFRITQRQSEARILSTARAPAPVYLAATPAFRWQVQETATRIERLRSSRRLRVEAARPWYETGQGERLAVIVAAAGVPVGRERWVTQIGRDPFASPATTRYPSLGWFPQPSGGPVARMTIPELGQHVDVVPYAVTSAGDRWCADIEISPPAGAASYCPFVQLALGRFQPDSLTPEMRLSPVVVSDPVRLMPDRRLVVERAGNGLRISLEGAGPTPPNRVAASLETCDLPAGGARRRSTSSASTDSPRRASRHGVPFREPRSRAREPPRSRRPYRPAPARCDFASGRSSGSRGKRRQRCHRVDAAVRLPRRDRDSGGLALRPAAPARVRALRRFLRASIASHEWR